MMPVRVAENLKLRAEAQAGQRATVPQLPAKTDARRTSFFWHERRRQPGCTVGPPHDRARYFSTRS